MSGLELKLNNQVIQNLTSQAHHKRIKNSPSTMVTPFLLALPSRNRRVKGGCAQYCKASRNIVVSAAVDNVSVLAAAILAAAPPMMERGD